MNAAQLYEGVTNSIIKDLEAGVAPWVKPWKAGARGGMLPFNSISNRSYSGINIPILWDAWMRRGYPTQGWLTYKQAQAAGGQVRGGEKGTHIVFTRKVAVKDAEEEDKLVRMLRTFVVFNEAQIDGLPAPPEIAEPDVDP